MNPLSDDELAAYYQYAVNESDAPLASMAAELLARRAGDRGNPWAILIVAAPQVPLIPAILAAARAPLLVLAAEGTKVRKLDYRGASRCLLDTYDPASPVGLRHLLQKHRIDLL